MSVDTPPFASSRIDRDAATRMSDQRLIDAWGEAGAQVLRLRGVEIPVRFDSAARASLALVPTGGSLSLVREQGAVGHVYLGRMEGKPIFAETAASDSAPPASAEWAHPFEAGEFLDDAERELLAIASGLLRWHDSSAHSPRDGAPTRPALGGWARIDPHGGEHFPRTDPAVIVLIEHENRALLGSNVLWETGRFSLLAGFVEAGESLEQAVRREVFEESGVRLGDVEYLASQPWPFPRSLMLGFRARLAPGVDPEHLAPDPEEISELRWFSREQLHAPEPGIMLPGGMSIARWLLDAWVAEGDSGEG